MVAWFLTKITPRSVFSVFNPKHHVPFFINRFNPKVKFIQGLFFVFYTKARLVPPLIQGEAPAMKIQLSATDVLAPTTMKNAAKCDT